MALPPVPPPGSFGARAWEAMTRLNVAVYRMSGGRIGGRMGKAPVALVHHVGRKSGRERVSPLLYLDDGEDVVIVASRGGSKANPAWYYNLKAAGQATIEIGRERRRVKVREVSSEEERDRLWPRLVEIWPDYDAYQKRTDRQIPLLVLSPAGR